MAHDRRICPEWRANALIDTPPKRKTRSQIKNNTHVQHVLSGCVQRCLEEYFATDKVINVPPKK
jgi:hypothetical protein